jgi:hypothetical protein
MVGLRMNRHLPPPADLRPIPPEQSERSTLIPVGVYYCTAHEGVMSEDQSICDFADADDECTRHRCFIITGADDE